MAMLSFWHDRLSKLFSQVCEHGENLHGTARRSLSLLTKIVKNRIVLQGEGGVRVKQNAAHR
jgi:hypothetical protein